MCILYKKIYIYVYVIFVEIHKEIDNEITEMKTQEKEITKINMCESPSCNLK